MNRISRFLVPCLVFAGGILFFVLGFRNLQNSKTFLPASGVISDIQVEYDVGADGNRYHVLVRYDIDGTEHESELGEYNSSTEIGDAVDILYNPANPDVIMPANPFGTYLQLTVGCLCVIGSVWLIYKASREGEY